MEKPTDLYLTCPRFKGQKKHIRVCRRCRRNRTCRVYQQHVQMTLPLGDQAPQARLPLPFEPIAVEPRPQPDPEELLRQIRGDLLKIRSLLS
jgi:hypothetical protein